MEEHFNSFFAFSEMLNSFRWMVTFYIFSEHNAEQVARLHIMSYMYRNSSLVPSHLHAIHLLLSISFNERHYPDCERIQLQKFKVL